MTITCDGARISVTIPSDAPAEQIESAKRMAASVRILRYGDMHFGQRSKRRRSPPVAGAEGGR